MRIHREYLLLNELGYKDEYGQFNSNLKEYKSCMEENLAIKRHLASYSQNNDKNKSQFGSFWNFKTANTYNRLDEKRNSTGRKHMHTSSSNFKGRALSTSKKRSKSRSRSRNLNYPRSSYYLAPSSNNQKSIDLRFGDVKYSPDQVLAKIKAYEALNSSYLSVHNAEPKVSLCSRPTDYPSESKGGSVHYHQSRSFTNYDEKVYFSSTKPTRSFYNYRSRSTAKKIQNIDEKWNNLTKELCDTNRRISQHKDQYEFENQMATVKSFINDAQSKIYSGWKKINQSIQLLEKEYKNGEKLDDSLRLREDKLFLSLIPQKNVDKIRDSDITYQSSLKTTDRFASSPTDKLYGKSREPAANRYQDYQKSKTNESNFAAKTSFLTETIEKNIAKMDKILQKSASPSKRITFKGATKMMMNGQKADNKPHLSEEQKPNDQLIKFPKGSLLQSEAYARTTIDQSWEGYENYSLNNDKKQNMTYLNQESELSFMKAQPLNGKRVISPGKIETVNKEYDITKKLMANPLKTLIRNCTLKQRNCQKNVDQNGETVIFRTKQNITNNSKTHHNFEINPQTPVKSHKKLDSKPKVTPQNKMSLLKEKTRQNFIETNKKDIEDEYIYCDHLNKKSGKSEEQYSEKIAVVKEKLENATAWLKKLKKDMKKNNNQIKSDCDSSITQQRCLSRDLKTIAPEEFENSKKRVKEFDRYVKKANDLKSFKNSIKKTENVLSLLQEKEIIQMKKAQRLKNNWSVLDSKLVEYESLIVNNMNLKSKLLSLHNR